MFTKKQLDILHYVNEHKPYITILDGAVRTGKSILNDWLFLIHIGKFIDQKKQFILTGKTIGSIERNVLVDLRDIFGLKIRLDQFNRFTILGNTVNCFGTDTQEAYKGISGFTAYGWYANEVTYSQKEAVMEAMGRCSGQGSRIFWDCNPDAPNHYIKNDYIDKADGKSIYSCHFVLEDNTYLNIEYINNLKMITPSGVFYDRKILGLWTSAEGMIYKDWNPDKMVVDKVPEISRYIAGVDWGYDHMGGIIVIGIDGDGNHYLVHEIAEKEKNIDWWVVKQKELIQKYGNMPFYCDSARPEYVEAFRGIEAHKEVVEGIEYVSGLMKKGKLFVLKDACPEFLREIYLYRWDTKSIKEQPIKRDDDSMDMIRYACMTDYYMGVMPANTILKASSFNNKIYY